MLQKAKDLWASWKVQLSFVGGALVVSAVWGTCTYEPPEADLEVSATTTDNQDGTANTTSTEADGETTTTTTTSDGTGTTTGNNTTTDANTTTTTGDNTSANTGDTTTTTTTTTTGNGTTESTDN